MGQAMLTFPRMVLSQEPFHLLQQLLGGKVSRFGRARLGDPVPVASLGLSPFSVRQLSGWWDMAAVPMEKL